MKLFFIVFILVSTTGCYCQNCKFQKKEIIDEISGLSVLVQKNQHNINRPGAITVTFYYSTNRCWIHLNIRVSKGAFAREMSFSQATPVVFIFNDSSRLQLLPSIEYSKDAMFSFSGSLWTSEQFFYATYDISKEDVELLATKEIERIRINYSLYNGDGNLVDSVRYKENRPSSAGKKHIQTSSLCILGVKFNDPNTCLKAMVRSKNIDTIAQLSKEELLEKIQTGKISTTLRQYQNFDEVQIGDLVTIIQASGDLLYGIVNEKNGQSTVKIKTNPLPGSEKVIDEDYRNILKTFVLK